jgi:uncharacterized repeat protein (TIGR01451 family)
MRLVDRRYLLIVLMGAMSSSALAQGLPVDLQVTKTDGVTTVLPGQTVTYTIVVSNAGPTSLGVNEVQTVTISGGAGTFSLTFNGQTTGALAFNATAAAVQTALAGLSSIGGVGGSVTVVAGGGVYTVTFGGTLAFTDVASMTATGAGGASAVVATVNDGVGPATITDVVPAALLGASYTATQSGGASGFTAAGSGSINDTLVAMPVGSSVTYTLMGTVASCGSEVQTATVSGGAGTFTLTFNGQTTVPLAFNATAAQVQTALAALPSIGGVGGTVTVVAGGGVYTVTFGGSLALTNVSQMTGAGAGGAIVVVATATDGGCASTLVNTVVASVPAGVSDTNLANNSSTDTDAIAAVAAPSVGVPTLDQWAMLTLGLFVLLLALPTLRCGAGRRSR